MEDERRSLRWNLGFEERRTTESDAAVENDKDEEEVLDAAAAAVELKNVGNVTPSMEMT